MEKGVKTAHGRYVAVRVHSLAELGSTEGRREQRAEQPC